MNANSGSDITEGKVKKARLPNDVVYAADLAIVQAIAEDKSKIIFSALVASGTDYSTGDVWYQRVAGAIIAQWEFTAGAWASRTLDGAVVVNLSASRITTGTLSAGTTIIVGDPAGARVELDSSGLRQYASDGTAVLLNTADDAMFRARGDNTAVGSNSQAALTTGDSNTAVGANTQAALTTGTYNTAVGDWSQTNLTIADSNTAVGLNAQHMLTIGNSNTVVGSRAQELLTTGYYNTAVGDFAQNHLTTGHDNTAVGSFSQSVTLGGSGYNTTTASYQTSIGPESGQSSATQVDGITTVGYRATAGAANATSIGREARADHAGSIALGYQTVTTQPDQVMVGPRDIEITDTTKGIVLVSPDNTRYRVTVANGGALAGGGGSPPSATDTVAGIVELATSAEAVTGTDTVRAVTPAGVAAKVKSVNYTQAGTATLTSPTTAVAATAAISFGVTFAAAPTVESSNVITAAGVIVSTYPITITTTGFIIRFKASASVGANVSVGWVAVGILA